MVVQVLIYALSSGPMRMLRIVHLDVLDRFFGAQAKVVDTIMFSKKYNQNYTLYVWVNRCNEIVEYVGILTGIANYRRSPIRIQFGPHDTHPPTMGMLA